MKLNIKILIIIILIIISILLVIINGDFVLKKIYEILMIVEERVFNYSE